MEPAAKLAMMVGNNNNPSPTRCDYYAARTLPFHYAEENESTGMTALSGLAAYLDLAEAARLGKSVRRHVGVREGTQGWTDAQMVMSLVMLNLSGGESVDDPRSSRGQALRLLERDEGLGRVLLAGSLTGCGG